MAFRFILAPFDTVEKIIKDSWNPEDCDTEKKCEQSLARKLGEILSNQKIERQYGVGKQRVDILVADKVPIEIKNNLKSSSSLQRLIGQTELYLKKWNSIIVVICGSVSRNLFIELKEYAEDKNSPYSEPMRIIMKGKWISNV